MKELRKITQEELEEILHKHELWLENKEGGEKADLSYVDLRGANLEYANLEYANLTHANLEYANLKYANLIGADLIGANLTGVYLEGTTLEYANLDYANLKCADLECGNLTGAYLTNTILQDTIIPNDNKEYIKEEIKVLETNSMDFNKAFDIVRYAIDSKNVNEIIMTEDKIEIKKIVDK